jgi:endonuclease/exonuclease/phosphatase family metal-dependent hydrolase
LLDGSTDLAAFLARRLQMQVLFQGTADPVWGNALLTRLPILEQGAAPLPLAGTLLPRGYLWATLDAGLPEPLLVIVTHLHHVESEHAPRLAQVPVLLDFWDGRPYTLLVGDLNSEPGYLEMGLMREAGLLDAWAAAGTGDGLTWPAIDPFERIDWIWHTPDLRPLYRCQKRSRTSLASAVLPSSRSFLMCPAALRSRDSLTMASGAPSPRGSWCGPICPAGFMRKTRTP